jgi:hypothetical protein
MKTIEEYNKPKIEAFAQYQENIKNLGTGVECPYCKSELCRRDAYSVLSSMPPQLDVYCRQCGFKTFILA